MLSKIIFSIILILTNSGILIPKGFTEEKIKQIIDPLVKGKSKVGLIVGIIKNGSKYTFAYGSKSLEDKTLPDGNTLFEIGSITKTFTGVLLADMVLNREVLPTDPVSKFISLKQLKLPTNTGREITLQDLAHHTSGIPTMPDNLGEFRKRKNPFSDYAARKMFQFLNGCKLDFPPGTNHRYSNSGFGLLAYILTIKSKKTYEDLVTERIFKPLGMNRSSIRVLANQQTNLATGYSLDLQKQPFWSTTDILNGSGFIKSTLNDMLIYLEAAMGKETLLTRAFRLATVEQRPAYPATWIGFGWYTELMKNGDLVVTHNGATGGFYAFIGFIKKKAMGIVLLSNHKNYRELDPLGYEILTNIQ